MEVKNHKMEVKNQEFLTSGGGTKKFWLQNFLKKSSWKRPELFGPNDREVEKLWLLSHDEVVMASIFLFIVLIA